jgi:hypothetical protein
MEWFKMNLIRLLGPPKTSLESFFFPWKGNPRGSHPAIPNRFEIPGGDPANASQDIDYVYEEEVYDLEPLRYPFKIQLMEDLPKRMIEQLGKHIANKYISIPELYGTWEVWKKDALREISRSKLPTSTIANDTWIFLSSPFEVIHPNDECIPDRAAGSRDERVAPGIHLKLRSSGERIVLGEGLYPRTAEIYIRDLVKLASGELPSSFEGELPNKFVGHEALIAKACHLPINDHFMTLNDQLPSSRTR